MPTKQKAQTYPRITAPFPTTAPVIRGRPVKSMTLLAEVELRVADMTTASTPTEMRRLAAEVYAAIDAFRTQNIEERMWLARRSVVAADSNGESAET